jgi:membrane protease YdiL (CAAX protease family)
MSATARPGGKASAIAGSCAIALASAAALGFALHPPARADSIARFAVLGIIYAVMTALASLRLHRRSELRRFMMPRAGDLALGFGVAALFYGAATIGAMAMAPHGTPREAWLIQLYAVFGDPALPEYHTMGAAIFVIAALEEITWRGLVLQSLEAAIGARGAWLLSAALYAAAALPTAFLLGAARAGPNPLAVVAALGGGLVWGYMTNRMGRLPPAIFAHAIFTWALVEFPIWRP